MFVMPHSVLLYFFMLPWLYNICRNFQKWVLIWVLGHILRYLIPFGALKVYWPLEGSAMEEGNKITWGWFYLKVKFFFFFGGRGGGRTKFPLPQHTSVDCFSPSWIISASLTPLPEMLFIHPYHLTWCPPHTSSTPLFPTPTGLCT